MSSDSTSLLFRYSGSALILTLACAFGLSLSSARAAQPQVKQADLAIVLPAQRDLRIAAQDIISPQKEALLPRDLLQQVENAFRDTSVGDALQTENTYEDWTLVSLRIAPCAPLGVIPSPDTQLLCWPEVRLVWQPLLKDFRRYAVILKTFADDRAIHALYDFSPSIALRGAEAQRATELLEKVRTALSQDPVSALNRISPAELREFAQLRDKASDALISKALSLRGVGLADKAFEKIDERPEFNDPVLAKTFINQLKLFVAEVAPRKELKEMTSFSLPEGREPPQSDDWVFLQFLKQRNNMVQQKIKIHSAEDGRVLFDLGIAPRASQMRDDPALHTALDSMNERDANEIKKRVLLSPSEVGTKSSTINDRNITLVPNTSCASCHKFNNLRFDFHAFSYLEDRQISVSPRVRTDVLRDLEWLKQRVGR